MTNISEILDKYGNRPVAVLGGGPSLPGDMEWLRPGTVLISVNDHALHICEPEFIVFMDTPARCLHLRAALDGSLVTSGRCLRVSTVNGYSDFWLNAPFWDGGFSSSLATWLACYISRGEVLLCGMDCYRGPKHYFYNRGNLVHPATEGPLENHVNAWRGMKVHCRNPERIRAMSGPLMDL